MRDPTVNETEIVELRPTQMTVGLREVEVKRREWREAKAAKRSNRNSYMIVQRESFRAGWDRPLNASGSAGGISRTSRPSSRRRPDGEPNARADPASGATMTRQTMKQTAKPGTIRRKTPHAVVAERAPVDEAFRNQKAADEEKSVDGEITERERPEDAGQNFPASRPVDKFRRMGEHDEARKTRRRLSKLLPRCFS